MKNINVGVDNGCVCARDRVRSREIALNRTKSHEIALNRTKSHEIALTIDDRNIRGSSIKLCIKNLRKQANKKV